MDAANQLRSSYLGISANLAIYLDIQDHFELVIWTDVAAKPEKLDHTQMRKTFKM